MQIKVTVHRVRLGSDEFRVIRPAEPIDGAAVLDDDRWVHLYADMDWARRVGVLWLLAARSRRSLIHLAPRGALPDEHADAGLPPLDLVLLHHSLQFAPARWKPLRSRLGRGRPHTVDIPETDLPDPAVPNPARHHRENLDLFAEHLHADTLFLVGSAEVFRRTADRFFDVATKGPDPSVTRHRDHYCAELHPGDGVLGRTARRFHVVYHDDWR